MPDINDLMPNTPDLNRERLEQLKRLMPDLFTADGRLDPDELKHLVDSEWIAGSEKFEFRWFGKADAKRRAFTPTTAALQYDAARSVNPDVADGNMIIEGENLEVLKCLLSAYREKIKCIYIDPPYNTGNDFVYSDNYSEQRRAYWEQTGVTEDGVKVDTNSESAGRYHSNWLNMMYPRLLAARQLLREDGVIFISIDDHEVHHLRKLCDEVFGGENFLGQLIWHRRQNADNRNQNNISADHEYVIAYGKSQSSALSGVEIDITKYTNPDNDPRGPWASIDLSGLATKDQRPNLHFDIIDPATGLAYPPNPSRGWSKSKENVQKLIATGEILFPRSPTGRPRQKKFLKDLKTTQTGFSTMLKAALVGFTTNGTRELTEIFEAKHFDFPKPTRLIKLLVGQILAGNDVALDFFAGSGTTGQAVMELNKEDGGNRKFILVQIPELTDEKSEAFKAGYKKISDITIERNKRVIGRIEQEQAEKQQQGLFEQGQEAYQPGFKTYRLVKSHFPRVEFQPDPEQTAEENIALLRQYIVDKEATLYSLFNEADIFDEVMLKNGFQLNFNRELLAEFANNAVYRVSDGHKTALVCLDPELNDATVAALGGRDEIFICLERAVDTTKKWNLKHQLGEKLVAF
ncbi:site-specific DNA-methyltransferase [Desulfuromonas carbonis]